MPNKKLSAQELRDRRVAFFSENKTVLANINIDDIRNKLLEAVLNNKAQELENLLCEYRLFSKKIVNSKFILNNQKQENIKIPSFPDIPILKNLTEKQKELRREELANIEKLVFKEEGETLLHIAARNGLYKITELLLEHGADINCKNDEGLTPLQLALLNKKFDIFNLLLKKEANIHSDDNAGHSIMHYIAIDKRLGQLGLELLKNSNIATCIPKSFFAKRTPLQTAIYENADDTLITWMIYRAGSLSNQDINGNTAAHLLVENKKADLLSYALKFKPNISITNNYGETPFQYALLLCHYECAKAFIDAGLEKETFGYLWLGVKSGHLLNAPKIALNAIYIPLKHSANTIISASSTVLNTTKFCFTKSPAAFLLGISICISIFKLFTHANAMVNIRESLKTEILDEIFKNIGKEALGFSK